MTKHSEQRILPFTPQQIYALVADIERYPEFLPWCLGARITDRQNNVVTADLIIGYKAFREKFTSTVTLDEPHRIMVRYVAGPLSHLVNEWQFTEISNGHTELIFDVEFDFRSSLLGAMMDMLFDKAFRKMVGAFEQRAEALYGTAQHDL